MFQSEDIKKRNAVIYKLRKKRSSLKDIALKYGISSVRVRQILSKMEHAAQKNNNK